MPKPNKQIEIPSIRRPILEALAEAPDDVFGHAIERLAGLDAHLNDVIRGFSADASEAATKITTAVQDHQDTVAAQKAAAEEAAANPPAPKKKAAKKAAEKKSSNRRK
jgi:hypothetical protein